jgi:DNA-directed RNA polymerase specialized sigma subunit
MKTLTNINLVHPARPKMKRRRHKQYPSLTKEQQKLVQEHSWIAGRLAYGAKCLTGGHTGSLTREDLESIANFALCVAATRYEPDKQVQFSTFAWRTAKGYIQHALRDYSRLVKTPRWVAKYKNSVNDMLKEKKTYQEIGESLGISPTKVLIVEMAECNYHVSYDSSPEDWVTREFIYNDDDIRPYVISAPLVEAMKGLTEAEMSMLLKYVEGREMPEEEYEWASDRFFLLQTIAHGRIDE